MEITKEELEIVGSIFSMTDTLVEIVELDEPEMVEDLALTMELDDAKKIAKDICRAYLRNIWGTEEKLLLDQGLPDMTREMLFSEVQ